jgi:hypothetical protein
MENDEEMETAIRVFAHYLGLDINTEEDLLPAVRTGFYDLPDGWEVGIGDGAHSGIPYFYNAQTEESAWQHPREQQCRRRLEIARARKRDRVERGQSSRGRGGTRLSEDSDQSNRRGEDRQQGRRTRDASLERPTPREHEATAVEDFSVVEDLEDANSPLKPQARAASPVQTRPSTAGANGGMFMKSDDFLDGDAPVTHQQARPHTAGPSANTTQRVDHSMSPPLFKEMKDPNYQPTPGSDVEERRPLRDSRVGDRSQQGSAAGTSQGGAGRGASAGVGWAQAGAASESVLGGTGGHREEGGDRGADRRDNRASYAGDRDRDRDNNRERDVSNQRGRALRDREEEGYGGNTRAGAGRGWQQAGPQGDDRSRDRDRDRDVSRGGREGPRQDWREDPRDNRAVSRGRGERDDAVRDRDGGKGRDRDHRAGEDDNGPYTQRSNSSGPSERDRFSARGNQQQDSWHRDTRGGAAQTSAAGTGTGSGAGSPHITEKERELRAEVERYKEDVRKLTEDCAEQMEKLGEHWS